MAREIKSIKNDVKIIVLSGDNDVKKLEAFSEFGVYGTIVKSRVKIYINALSNQGIDPFMRILRNLLSIKNAVATFL
jgi:DNA-binding NarL/FixJ family response regulator